ncbi:MAG: trypsin-like peptidase domain-containing protein [Sporomusaceae bacterium]|nr:trypsin-like peptidase domain-containing protein [Sporomusaceae bacterium]
MKTWYRKVAPYLLVAIVGAFVGGSLVVGCAGPAPANPKSQLLKPNTAEASISDARNTPIVRAAQKISPAVVGISNKAYARDFFNRKVLVDQGQGSGVIFDSQGYIATNNHVVQNAQELTITLLDGRSFPGKVLGADPATDLAVVKIEATDLPVAPFGDSDQLLVGEPAIAIGNPLGSEFKGSVTAGIISALNRTLDIGERRFKLIQTDAAINPGNSGGALVNADGVVIGINSAKISFTGVEGLGFAIPINTARPILQSLIEKGKVIRPYLGVSIVDAQTARQYGYTESDKGLFVAKIFQDTPASKAGIKLGDVILKVDGKDINSIADLREVLDVKALGSKAEVVILRDNAQRTIAVTLEEMPASEEE